jgi:signal transduction histidine kinase
MAARSALSAEDMLERCFQELVCYYRHSGAGRRLGGVVHKMNGPLQVISFQLEFLEQKARAESRFYEECPASVAEKLEAQRNYRLNKLRHIREELEKLQGLTRAIIHLGLHEDSQDRVLLDLNRLFQEELETYQAHPFFKHRVERDFRWHQALPPILGHYLDFSQSFRNLLDNAWEAMKTAPLRRLTVETDMEEGCRVLRIGDTGVGIPPEVLPRIFDPFFTSKGGPEGPRAGLGLFMTRRLLAPYKAQIQVESRLGETWVTVRLPVGGVSG